MPAGPTFSEDSIARHLALEAVIGLKVADKRIDRESVEAWLSEATKGCDDPKVFSRARYYALRIIDGPWSFDAYQSSAFGDD